MKQLYLLLLFSILSLSLQAQPQPDRYISGQIITDGEPIPGVTLVVKGTARGTVADIDGRYYLEVALGETVQISFIGLQTREIKITEDNSKLIAELPSTESKVEEEKAPIHWTSSLPKSTEDKTFSPYMFVKSNDPTVDQLPLKSNHVLINIAGVIAHVQVRQTYVNQGERPIEAVYVFPGSTRAAVHSMVMQVGNRKIKAQIKEKQKAREIYEEAKSEGKTASLLEQNRPNVFTMNVANILPGDTVSITMEYTELLVPEEGTYEFVYPTVVGPRFNGERIDKASQNTYAAQPYSAEGDAPAIDFFLRAQLNTPIPAKRVNSPSHQIQTNKLSKGITQIMLDSTEIDGGNRDFILNYSLRGNKIESGLMVHEGEKENYFLLMVEPPQRKESITIPPREYLFVVDVSGSMTGEPLDISKSLMRELLSQLRPEDQFNILVFAGTSGWLNDTPLSPSKDNVDKAMEKLDKISGGGGTYLLDALKKGMELSPDGDEVARTYVILTDGYITVEREAMNYIRSHRHQANLFAVGIGYSTNRHIIEGMAYAGKGEPYFISDPRESKEVSKRLSEAALSPILSHARLQAQGMEIYDVEPFSLSDVMADRPLIVFGKYKNRDKGALSITGTAGEGPWSAVYPLAEATTEDNEALPLLWARERIRYLDDWATSFESRSEQEIEAEVTRLGLQHSLLTRFTSFVAVDDTIRNEAPEETQKVNQPLPLPKGVSNLALLAGTASAISLQSDVTMCEEVVVTAVGAERSKRSLAYSISTISGETDPMTSLNSTVAGVNISGASGVSTSVAIRGQGQQTITGKSKPLYIVDGIPVEDPTLINPEAASDITILKGSQATAIYGSRASNGVVLINTSKYYMRNALELNISTGWEEANRLPARQNQFGQGQPVAGTPTLVPGSAFSWGPEAAISGYQPQDLYRKGWHNKQSILWKRSIKEHQFRASLSRDHQNNIIPGLSAKSHHLGLDWKNIADRLRMDVSGKASWFNKQGIATASPFDSYLAGVLLSPAGFDLTTRDAAGRFLSGSNLVSNPNQITAAQPLSTAVRTLSLSAKADYEIAEWLTWTGQWSGSSFRNQSAGGIAPGNVYSLTGRAFDREETIDEQLIKTQLSSRLEEGSITFRTVLSATYNQRNRNIFRTDGEDLSGGGDISIASARNRSTWQAKSQHRLFDLGIEHRTDWRDAVYLTLSKHWKNSNSLPAGEQALDFNQAQLSIRPDYIVQMPYGFDAIKIYGNVAALDLDAPFWLDAGYRFAGASLLEDRWFAEPVRTGQNPALKAARQQQWEAGVEIEMRKITIETSYQQQATSNYYLPASTATGSQLVNAGTLHQSEWQATIAAGRFGQNGFSWSPQFKTRIPRNEMRGLDRIYLLSGTDKIQTVAQNGAALGALYGSRWERDADGNKIIGADGFPVVAANPGLIGNPVPDALFSIENEFRLKSLRLDMDWLWIKGGDVWNGTRAMMDYYGTSATTAEQRGSSQTFAGVLADGSINSQIVRLADPAQGMRSYYWLRYGRGGVAEDYIEDASSLRLSRLSLRWDLPRHLLSGIKVREATIDFTATNLLVFSKYRGIDPRGIDGSLDLFNQPNTRRYQFNLKLTF